jgi:hypothetical protein
MAFEHQVLAQLEMIRRSLEIIAYSAAKQANLNGEELARMKAKFPDPPEAPKA